MENSKKCNNVDCDNLVTERNKKTKELKKFCSTECRYKTHSSNMIKHPQSEDAPRCSYYRCDNYTDIKTTGIWKKYCSPQCQNKQTAFNNSEESKSFPPMCKNPSCE